MECIAAVPVGLTKYRQGLCEISPFDKKRAGETLDILEEFGEETLKKYGERRVFGADEFYILAERKLPDADFYEEFLQLENGVGLVPLLLSESDEAIALCDYILKEKRNITISTGESAYPFIKAIVDKTEKKWDNLKCNVVAVKNNFFGGHINVAGLITATDLEEQLKGKDLGEELLIPSVMLRDGGDMFLDSVTLEELSQKLNIKITPVDNDGFQLLDKILGIKE